MELGWFEDFLTLADCGNFSRAAEARGLTQPAFSRRIRALEDWAGAALIDRSTHQSTLTEAGRALHPFAADIARRVEQSRAAVREAAGATATTLRFAATHGLSLTFFPQWLRGLEARGHVGGVALLSDTQRACEQALLQGQAQFLLRHHHPAIPERLESNQFMSLRVGDDALAPLCAPDANGAPLRPLRCESAAGDDPPTPYLAYSADSALGWIVGAAQQTAGPAPLRLETVFTAHLATVLLTLARDGRGAAWLPLSLAQTDIDAGRLVPAGGPEWTTTAEIRLYRPRARQTPAAEKFWSLLLESSPTEKTLQALRRNDGKEDIVTVL